MSGAELRLKAEKKKSKKRKRQKMIISRMIESGIQAIWFDLTFRNTTFIKCSSMFPFFSRS